jgi:hypothetical protein
MLPPLEAAFFSTKTFAAREFAHGGFVEIG